MPSILETVIEYQRLYDGAVVMREGDASLSRAGLASRVAAAVAELAPLPLTIGLCGDNGIDWAVAQLASWFAGKTVVPIPAFFSPQQLRHLSNDAGISHVVTTEVHAARIYQLGLSPVVLSQRLRSEEIRIVDGGGEIIYTSGTTGAPKGVRHSLSQIAASANSLAKATRARKDDVYLSLLPLPLLLETICALAVPLVARGSVIFSPQLTRNIVEAGATSVALAIERHRPTATVVVPQVLSQWVAQLEMSGTRACDTLRFVAVGGAPLAASLAEKAWRVGIPVHEGYGLSECCSVVALNRPGERKAGTVGRALDDVSVSIEDGEICVSGPTVMDGYTNAASAPRKWCTGDLGHWDEDGYLVVDGRKDSVLVTSNGRNISPEWIEAMIAADPRVMAVALVGHGADALTAVVVPSGRGLNWFGLASQGDLLGWIADLCCEAPNYAVPRACVVIGPEDALGAGLITANGRVQRSIASEIALSAKGRSLAA